MKKRSKLQLNQVVFWPAFLIMVAMVVVSFADQELFAAVTQRGTTWIANSTMWYVCLNMVFQTVFILLFCFIPAGKKRLGGPDAKPIYKNFTWFAMCLCASIGSGIVFWGVGQPMTYLMETCREWGLEPGSVAAAVKGMAQCNWEWSGQYWFFTIYTIAIGLACYNYGQPLRVSSFTYLFNGREVSKKVRNVVDILSVIAIVAGVTCSLGNGIMQISSGLDMVFGIPVTKVTWLFVCVGVVAFFMISSASGINKGISKLSNFNVYLFSGVLIFIFIVGPGKYILSLFTESTAYLFEHYLTTAAYTGFLDDATWTKAWPFWQFVGASGFAPLFGVFMAKISYGRTVREVIMGLGLLPCVFNIIWFCVFGGYAFYMQTNGIYDVWGGIQALGAEASMFDFLRQLPMGSILVYIFLVVVIVSFVTMADSCTTSAALVTTDTELSIDGDGEPPMSVKFIWGILMGTTAYTFISFAGIDGAKSCIQLFDFPLHVMSTLCMAAIIRCLFGKTKAAERYGSKAAPPSGKEEEKEVEGQEIEEAIYS